MLIRYECILLNRRNIFHVSRGRKTNFRKQQGERIDYYGRCCFSPYFPFLFVDLLFVRVGFVASWAFYQMTTIQFGENNKAYVNNARGKRGQIEIH